MAWALRARVDRIEREHRLSRDLRINEMIRVPQVRVVDEDGGQLGVMPTAEALGLAQEKGLDLVEVAPMASPPVTRLLDYGQFKYEQTRREKEARRHQRAVEFKEVRLTPKIGKGDFETKVRRAIQFLGAGGRVKVTVRFRGRELTHAHLGREMLFRFAELIKDHGTIERQPLLEGKSMSIVVASTHKPKPQGAPGVTAADATATGPATAPAVPVAAAATDGEIKPAAASAAAAPPTIAPTAEAPTTRATTATAAPTPSKASKAGTTTRAAARVTATTTKPAATAKSAASKAKPASQSRTTAQRQPAATSPTGE